MASNTEQSRLSSTVYTSLIILLLFQSIAICLVIAYLLYPFFTIESPQHVLTPRIQLGEPLGVEAEKCNYTFQDLTVGGATYWVRESPTYIRIKTTEVLLPNGASFKPGCIKRIYSNKQPAETVPGIWHLEGTSSYISPLGVTRTVSWHSEPFEIFSSDSDSPSSGNQNLP